VTQSHVFVELLDGNVGIQFVVPAGLAQEHHVELEQDVVLEVRLQLEWAELQFEAGTLLHRHFEAHGVPDRGADVVLVHGVEFGVLLGLVQVVPNQDRVRALLLHVLHQTLRLAGHFGCVQLGLVLHNLFGGGVGLGECIIELLVVGVELLGDARSSGAVDLQAVGQLLVLVRQRDHLAFGHGVRVVALG